ncbi:hypothetical protein BDFB_012570, partial [Asbolus verrucosus]
MIVTGANETLKSIQKKAPVVNYIVAQWEPNINKKREDTIIQINSTKTENILFTKKLKSPNFFNLKIKNHTIPITKTAKYLGIQLDTRLNFHNHKRNNQKSTHSHKNIIPTTKQKQHDDNDQQTTVVQNVNTTNTYIRRPRVVSP